MSDESEICKLQEQIQRAVTVAFDLDGRSSTITFCTHRDGVGASIPIGPDRSAFAVAPTKLAALLALRKRLKTVIRSLQSNLEGAMHVLAESVSEGRQR